MREFIVNRNDAGQRLDKFLTKALNGLPASLMYKFIRTKKIKVNRKRAAQNYILAVDDVISLYIPDEFFRLGNRDAGAVRSIEPKLDIIYEDENIMLLNKRPGILVHEDAGDVGNTLIMHVKAYLYRRGEYDAADENSFAPSLCNRIDRNTGGIVIAAKNAAALRLMNEKIKNNRVKKFYLCAVHGEPSPAGATLRAYLIKDSKSNTVSIFDRRRPGSKEIVTRYRTLRSKGGMSLLEVELLTGRTHQIRAHMAHIGHPLAGDGKYGINRADRARGYRHQALYAYRLKFDFNGENDLLSYLDGRSFSINLEEIWFLKDFGVKDSDDLLGV